MAETTFYSNGNVTVTNTRAIMEGKTYALSNVSSVRMVVMPVNYTLMVLMLFIGLALASFGFSGGGSVGSTTLIIGILLVVVALALAAMMKPSYAVVLGSASGETHALASKDKAEIGRIVEGVSNAIVHRG